MIRLNISNIQHFSTGDGPGIRTTVFFKGCHLHCPWCHNPETLSPKPQELYFESARKSVLYGRYMTVAEVVDEIMEDEDFYKVGGGGVTVSGGEPLLQSEGVAALASVLKGKGIPTIVDTAGDVPWECFRHVLDVTDAFYFDFKTHSKEIYSRVIGGDGERIYQNLCHLISEGRDVHVRIPLIPDVNTSEDACREMCKQLLAAGVVQVDLLPFHRMGSSKYDALGLPYAYRSQQPLTQKEISCIAEIYRGHFHVSVEA